MKEQTKMTDETSDELTPAYLRKIAEEANRKKKSLLEKTVYQCVEDNVNAINDLLTMMAKKGYYEMSSPINIYDKKYTVNIDESDTTEFADAVIKNLKSIYVKRGFKVPDIQSNYFKLGW